MYKLKFDILNDSKNEFNGFSNVETKDYFEAGWNIELLWHDCFEHFFENSKYFKTTELSQAGECVAMGLRLWWNDYTSCISEFSFSNRCIYKNNFEICLGQVKESEDEDYPQYSNNFNYKHLTAWNKKNIFEGYAKKYDEYYNIEKYYKNIETAMSYGYWLGEHLFLNKEKEVFNYMSNLKEFLKQAEFPNGMYDTMIYLPYNSTFNISVHKNKIVSKLNDITITNNSDIHKIMNKWENFIYNN